MRLTLCSALAFAVCAATPAGAASFPQTARPDPALIARCRTLALEMTDHARTAPAGSAQTREQRMAGAAMTVAASAARMAGGTAGGFAAEVLYAAQAEQRASAEEAQIQAITAMSDRLEAVVARMDAAGCTDAVLGAAPVLP